MGFAMGLAGQLARPSGAMGRLLGGAMDIANRKPTRLALDLLDPRDGERILDAGCGTGAALAGVLRRARVQAIGIDPSRTMVSAARKRLGGRAALLTTGIETMPFAERSCDAVLLLNVLYFCDQAGKMAASLYRVLKPGGRLVAYVTHRESMERWDFAQAGHHRLFDPEQLAEALSLGGFVPERICVQEVPITRSVRGLLVKAER